MIKNISVSVVFLLLVLSSCGVKYNLELQAPRMIQVSKALDFDVVEKDNNPIDSIQYFINGKRVLSSNGLDISSYKLGKQAISATVYYQGKRKILNNTIYFLAAYAPVMYTYKVLNEYPHDPKAYTQGFEYFNGYIYESTGERGNSSLRKVELETGKVLKKIDLNKKYFAEGMTILNGKIYQLTWQQKLGFVYDLENFELEKTFDYEQSKEGWGLTNDGVKLIKTDGTERMWFINAKTLEEQSFIETYTNKRKAEKLNELEYVKGRIYANIWQQNSILIVNPESGAIEGIANLKGLQEKAGQKGDDNVLNGIAYDKQNDRIFVTGKRWPKVFEIELIKK